MTSRQRVQRTRTKSTEQASSSGATGLLLPGDDQGGDNDWLYDTEDRVNTLGAGFKWSSINGKFDLTADYTFSGAKTEIDPTDIPIDTAIDFPDLETSTHAITLRGEYYPSNNLVWKMDYSYEHYSSDDWAMDGIGQEDITRVIWTGQESPDFTNHIISFYVTYYIM